MVCGNQMSIFRPLKHDVQPTRRDAANRYPKGWTIESELAPVLTDMCKYQTNRGTAMVGCACMILEALEMPEDSHENLRRKTINTGETIAARMKDAHRLR